MAPITTIIIVSARIFLALKKLSFHCSSMDMDSGRKTGTSLFKWGRRHLCKATVWNMNNWNDPITQFFTIISFHLNRGSLSTTRAMPILSDSEVCWIFSGVFHLDIFYETPIHRDMKCKDTSLSLNDLTGGRDLEVKFILGTNYSDMGNRTQDCELSMIGKPVLNHFVDIKQGAWMRDPVTRENITVEKIWLTKESEPNNLYEYKNRLDYQRSISSRISPFKLACSAQVRRKWKFRLIDWSHNFSCVTYWKQGNAHIIYNGYFYYYCDDQTKLIRYDLRSEKAAGEFNIKIYSFTFFRLSFDLYVLCIIWNSK